MHQIDNLLDFYFFSDIRGQNSESWQKEQDDTVLYSLSWLEQELG